MLTHNMLMCHKKGVKNGWPLKIEATKVEIESTDFNLEFIKNMLGKIDYKVFYAAAKQLQPDITLPISAPDDTDKDNEESFKQIHHALMEISVIEGHLICPESGRKFPVSNGIPNMLLNEDEV